MDSFTCTCIWFLFKGEVCIVQLANRRYVLMHPNTGRYDTVCDGGLDSEFSCYFKVCIYVEGWLVVF